MDSLKVKVLKLDEQHEAPKFQISLSYHAIPEKIVIFLYKYAHNINTYVLADSIKIENKAVSTKKVTTKEEALNLNLAESSEIKSLAFLVSLC